MINLPPPFSSQSFWKVDGASPASMLALKEQPELIFQRHGECLAAGADILLTASHGTSLKGLMQNGMYLREAREAIFSAVMLACMAREKYRAESVDAKTDANATHRIILIGAAIGPKPEGETLQEYYETKIEALLSPRKNYRVDFLAFEGMTNSAEVSFALALMKKYVNARITVTFSCEAEALRMQPLLDKDKQVAAWGLSGISTNATEEALKQLSAAREAREQMKPLMMYPEDSDRTWQSIAEKWRTHGVHLIRT